jgi:hypothetical protein
MAPPTHGDPGRAVDDILAFCSQTRLRILQTGAARSANLGGVIVDNTFEPPNGSKVQRQVQTEIGEIKVNKALEEDFQLFIKHPALFSALAPQLSQVIPLFAVIRHPLAVLASWQTVNMPVGRGRAPAAEVFCPDLTSKLDQAPDVLARQICLLRWLFQTYAQMPRANILTYEALVDNPASALEVMVSRPVSITLKIDRFEVGKRYEGVDLHRLARALLEIQSEVSAFYPNFADNLEIYLRP